MSPLMSLLGHQELVRELVIRQRWIITSANLYALVWKSLPHVEAVFIFMSGNIQTVQYDTCLARRGPFPFCVVNGNRGARRDCANCWWLRTARTCHRCSFTLPTNAYQTNAPPNRDPFGLTPANRREITRVAPPVSVQIQNLMNVAESAKSLNNQVELRRAFEGLHNASRQFMTNVGTSPPSDPE